MKKFLLQLQHDQTMPVTLKVACDRQMVQLTGFGPFGNGITVTLDIP